MAEASLARTVMDIVKMLLAFALLGPPFGWLTLFIPMMVHGFATGALTISEASAANIFFVLLCGLPLSYVLGLPLAVLAGVVVVVGQLTFRSFGLLHVVGVALIVEFAWLWRPDLLTVLFDMLRSGAREAAILSRSSVERLSVTGTVFILGSIGAFFMVPTLACWAIGRRWQTSDR